MSQYFPGLDDDLSILVDTFVNTVRQARFGLDHNTELLRELSGRRLVATLHPESAAYLEARTEEELEAEKPLIAIAAGVAAVVEAALQSHEASPDHTKPS